MLDINTKLLSKVQGENNNFFSINMTDVKDQTLQEYSTELLQYINFLSLPLSKLVSKIGAFIMPLHNLNQPVRLNNNSRIIAKCMGYHIITTILMSKDYDKKWDLFCGYCQPA